MSRSSLLLILLTAAVLLPQGLMAQSEKAEETESSAAASQSEPAPKADHIGEDEALATSETPDKKASSAKDDAAKDDAAKGDAAKKGAPEGDAQEFDATPPPPLTEAQKADWHARAKKHVEEEKKKAEAIANEPLPEPGYDCGDGLVFDDGSVETGYSFVPSAKWGMYLQQYDSADLPSRKINNVCVCWLRTRDDRDIDFEIIFMESKGALPATEPYAVRKASADLVPRGVDRAGHFYPVKIDDVEIPEGKSYIGVRWNPSVDSFFFVCSNKSTPSNIIPGFQRDDRSKGWDDILNTRDYIFDDHRSMMIRVTAEKPPAKAEGGEAAEGTSAKTSTN